MKKYNITFDPFDLTLKNSKAAFDFIEGTAQEDGVDKKEFDFTICQMYLKVSGTYSFEITWVDETPEGHEELESEILTQWQK